MERPMLKTIHPVSLLSFSSKTEPIELRRLNILIGPNGSGKSNFIEVIRLLYLLPEKEPWSTALATGGAGEWIWKSPANASRGALTATLSLGEGDRELIAGSSRQYDLSIELERYESSFRVRGESFGTRTPEGKRDTLYNWFERDGSRGRVHLREARADEAPVWFDINLDRSILAQLASPSLQHAGVGQDLPELFIVAEFVDSFDFHQDWEFGVYCKARDPQQVGQSIARIEEDGSNLAQVLAHFRDYEKPVFERLNELVQRFYEPAKNLEVRLINTHLQIALGENGGFSTPATRLSDGTLRWLYILAILLNPNPAPVTCIDEPELGLHPDIIPTLADLLREASERTQLIVTTHSSTLIDAFSDEPESVCVCEKQEGSTVIRRLSRQDLAVWLKDFSLGSLWISGQIGGNRW